MKDRIYLDNAATTAMAPEAAKAMVDAIQVMYGNASAVYATGREARKLIDNARRATAAVLGCSHSEVYFTSGGSESDNWAIKGVMLESPKKHMITTAMEHHAVLHTCQWLEKQGVEVTYLQPDREGIVSPESIAAAMRSDTALVSVMMANNELGTLQPIREIAAIAHQGDALMHTDAVQCVGTLPINVKELDVDLLSLSAHKFHGPKGIGALVVRQGVNLPPLIHGGAQERGKRGGTENTPAIVGLSEAITLAEKTREENTARIRSLRDLLEALIAARIPEIAFNGHREKRLPGHASVTFRGVEGESLLLRLDLAGVAASAGSACTSGSLESSHVLKAIGLGEEEASGTLRFTVGSENTEEEIREAVKILESIVIDLRRMRH